MTMIGEIRKVVSKVDVLDQAQITKLKQEYPGMGVGIAVGERLVAMVESGEIESMGRFPDKYRKLGKTLLG